MSVLRGLTALVSLPLLRRTVRAWRLRIVVVAVALAAWSYLLPVIFATFGRQMATLMDADLIPKPFLRLMGADPFSLDGAVALGWIHPIGLGLQLILPLAMGVGAVAGERQRGTLEVLLARPVSRRTLLLTWVVVLAGVVLVTVLAALAGTWVAALRYGVAADLDLGELALLGVNTVALLLSVGCVGLAASVSSDRLGRPLGFGIGFVFLTYLFDILGTLWPDADWLQPYSPFHYLQPLEILGARGDVRDVWVLLGVAAVALAYALWRFPRRDLAAPA